MNKLFTPPSPLNTAVLFLVFNRPDTTKQVFEAIRKAEPPRLYVAADGPRVGKQGEEKIVEVVRSIATNVDWDCEVKTLFRDKNLGCKYAVSGAISWFFEQEEKGIILEDDCLPSQSFFWFCEDLLYKYLDDERIYLITGYNKQNEWEIGNQSYFFSHFGGCWGWASWKSAWDKIDIEMRNLDEFASRGLFKFLLGNKLGKIREKELLNAPKTSWAYPWAFTRHLNSGLACVSTKNLIQNIGFDKKATHTRNKKKNNTQIIYDIEFPLKDNNFVVPDLEYDILFVNRQNLITKVKNRLKII